MAPNSLKKLILFTTIVWFLLGFPHSAFAGYGRDTIRIVGSSTVYPFASAVAEYFAETTLFKKPVVESTGSGGGIHLFCAGVGIEHPDITNASRRIRPEERSFCEENGVADILEIQIGYDGIVLANSKLSDPFALTRKEIFLALARRIPDPKNPKQFIPNPHYTWNTVNPTFPTKEIRVHGPSTTSGTRDAFLKLAMEKGADQFGRIDELRTTEKQRYVEIAHAIRDDGVYVEEGENDNFIVHKLEKNPDDLGIFGFSFLLGNADRLQGAVIEGTPPTAETIASGRYPFSRALFLYVKKAHIGRIPGLYEFLVAFTSDSAWGPEGYLVDLGLVPLTGAEREKNRNTVRQLHSKVAKK